MKLFYTTIFVLLHHCSANATTWNVAEANFSFNPASINVIVEDVIQFNWVSGNHTTTCGSALAETVLPAGAAEWDDSVTVTKASSNYTVTVAGHYLYGCTPHFFFGMQGNITVSNPLPIKFGSFSVAGSNTKDLLTWDTFSEINTSYFSIRKSMDATHFYEIGMVNAAGNSNFTLPYQFTDTDLGRINKYLYYEIATVDADKRESFSII